MNKLINYGRGPREVFKPGDTLDYRQKVYAKPRNLALPQISGSGTIGAVQSRIPGAWTGTPTVTYIWQLNGQTVATGGTYTPVIGDSGKTLTILETAKFANGLAATARSKGVTIP